MIKTVIIDVDGVLNDGKQAHDNNDVVEYYTGSGTSAIFHLERRLRKPFKTFHSRDKTAIRELISRGIRVIVVSADDNEISKTWVESCGAEFIHTPIIGGVKDISVLPEIDWNETAGIGDDLIDLPYLNECAIMLCPADASPLLLAMDDIIIMKTPGGGGIVSEFLYMIMTGEFEKRGYSYTINYESDVARF